MAAEEVGKGNNRDKHKNQGPFERNLWSSLNHPIKTLTNPKTSILCIVHEGGRMTWETLWIFPILPLSRPLENCHIESSFRPKASLPILSPVFPIDCPIVYPIICSLFNHLLNCLPNHRTKSLLNGLSNCLSNHLFEFQTQVFSSTIRESPVCPIDCPIVCPIICSIFCSIDWPILCPIVCQIICQFVCSKVYPLTDQSFV